MPFMSQIPQAKVDRTLEHLRSAVRDYGRVVYSNSLGAESMVLTDLIWSEVPEIEIFTLDTGRLHEETYSLIERLERRYQRRFKVYYPDPASIEAWVHGKGINGFYDSIENRQDAVRAIELVCAYLERNEPTNPAQLLLRRASRVIDKNFLQLVRDLAPDAVKDVARILGVDPSEIADQN